MKKIVIEIRQTISGFFEGKVTTYYNNSVEEGATMNKPFLTLSECQDWLLGRTSEEIWTLPPEPIDFEKLTSIKGKEG